MWHVTLPRSLFRLPSLEAVGHVARSRGMQTIAQSTGLGRESLYKALLPGAKPRYDTILRVLRSLGLKLRVSA